MHSLPVILAVGKLVPMRTARVRFTLPSARLRPVLGPLAILFLAVASAAPAQTREFIPDDSIRHILKHAVERGRTAGVVVGLLDSKGQRRVFAYGSAGPGGRALDGESVFEIGSITKVFTGILLADMARRGEAALTDPLASYLPAHVHVPQRNGKAITLADVATHFSGLPRMPSNFAPADRRNPYANYTIEKSFAFLSAYTLPRDPGESFEYSNFAMGVLGDALAARAGKSYEQLVTERILRPLGMHNTAITLSPWMRSRLAQGHDAFGDTTSNWDFIAMRAAGGLRSNANDMLTFAAANLNAGASGLGAAMRDAMRPRRLLGNADSIGLNWIVFRREGTVITAHNGGTGGYRTFLGLDRAGKRAVIVLTNSAGNGLDDVGMHLLDGGRPVSRPPVGARISATYRKHGIAAAVEQYRMLRAREAAEYAFDELQLNDFGYWLLNKGAIDDAVAILRLNVEAYPDAPNPYDSLGEALEKAGRIEEARTAYNRAVDLAEKQHDERLLTFRANRDAFAQRHPVR
jgi:CubicO group peptidase (beta-lactamase class C family)